MAAPLLETKLHAPATRRGLVARPRLIERLNRGVDTRLTLVSAPAGFGMTTLITAWLAACREQRPAAWLALDHNDNHAARAAGWLGLAGLLLLQVMWMLTAGFQFAEALILPLLATDAPSFVDGFVGISSGATSGAHLGALPTVFSIASVFYLLGGVLLGTATFRARVLPRLAGAALAVGTVAPIAFSLLPHEFIA